MSMSDTQPPVYGGVLCAGFGTRMAPITDRLPKPLIPFLNTPLLTYALNHLMRAGAGRVGINLHHLADTIPPIADRLCKAFGMEVSYAREWEILGTAGGARGIWQALDGFEEGTLLLLNSDTIMNIDLAAHLAAHRASGARATIVTRPREEGMPGGIWLDRSGALQGMRDARRPGAPPDSLLIEHTFIGVHFLEPSLLAELPEEEGCMVGDVYIPRMLDGEVFHVEVMDDFWRPLDNPSLYMAATRAVLSDPSLFQQAPLPEPLQAGMFVYTPSGIDGKAQLAAPVLTGVSVTLEPGAKVGPYAVLDGVEVKSGATVCNAALYGMGTVEGEWLDCVAVAGAVAVVKD